MSLIISTRVLYEDSDEIIELMKVRALSVFISLLFLLMQRYGTIVPT